MANTTVSGQKVVEIFGALKEILADLNEDWDVGEVTYDTRLVDLGLESISLVYLIAELQQTYALEDKLFRKMRNDGSLLKDMTVGDILTSLNELMAANTADARSS